MPREDSFKPPNIERCIEAKTRKGGMSFDRDEYLSNSQEELQHKHMYIHVTSSLTSFCVLLKPCPQNWSSISFSDKALPVPAQNDVHLEIFTTKKQNDAVESDIHAVFIWPC